MKFYVYKIINTINNKVYIGKCKDSIRRRWNAHKAAARKQDPNDYSKIHRALNKYGFDNFTIEQLAEFDCEQDSFDYEKNMIIEYNSRDDEFGYNITEGGDGATGYRFSEETKAAMNLAKKELFAGNGNPFYGKKHSDETKKIIAEKASIRMVGVGNPFYGKTHSEETRKHLSKLSSRFFGEKHPRATLTNQQVLEIREKYGKAPYDCYGGIKKLGEEYGISSDHVYDIFKRKIWKKI